MSELTAPATPGPYAAEPYINGSWNVLGRDGDLGDTHTVCRVEPCDTHPDRAAPDAAAIAQALNARGEAAVYRAEIDAVGDVLAAALGDRYAPDGPLADGVRTLADELARAQQATAEARQAGYAEAIARLRDDQRYADWWSAIPEDDPRFGYWQDLGRRHLSDYLETVGLEALADDVPAAPEPPRCGDSYEAEPLTWTRCIRAEGHEMPHWNRGHALEWRDDMVGATFDV